MVPPLPMLLGCASSSFTSRCSCEFALRRIPPCRRPLTIEPDIFEARAVVDAVDHQGHALDPRLKADGCAGVKDDWPDVVFRQPPLDLPHQLPALLRVGLDR